MASILYRKGDSHVVDGIQCEEARVDASEVAVMLQNGWVSDVNLLAENKDDEVIVDDLNDLPSNKNELASIALEYGVTLDKKKSVKSLQEQVRGLINGDQSGTD